MSAILKRDKHYQCPECIDIQVGGHIQNHLKRMHGYRYAGGLGDVMMSPEAKPLILRDLQVVQ